MIGQANRPPHPFVRLLWYRYLVYSPAKWIRQSETGFTLAEVLISLLIVSIFVMVTLEALMLAAIFKTRAEQYDQAYTWIQEDLELVKFKASEYEKDAFPPARCSATDPSNGLAAGFLSDIGGSPQVMGPRLLGGKNLILTRTAVYATSADPFKLLQINYAVTPQDGGTAIATLYTEVLPHAALKCP
jgi:prepilin-type N-terminal cleavage/methylation domain-containing protein